MTDQEIADILSKDLGRPVSLAEAYEIHRDLAALADITIDAYFDFKKKGILDSVSQKTETVQAGSIH